MANNNVVLVGMMGSGKSTVGRRLAEAADMTLVDLDAAIEELAGARIKDLFAQPDGERLFRDYETRALESLLDQRYLVISTGGGAVERERNRELLRQLGHVFWLDAPPATLLERIGDGENRPMLHRDGRAPIQNLKILLKNRHKLYAAVSDSHIDTSEMDVNEIVEHIMEEIEPVLRHRSSRVYSTQVAIDGPAGAGKSTVAARLAERLEYDHIDTGAMYRSVTLAALQDGALTDEDLQLPAGATVPEATATALTMLARVKNIELRDEHPLVRVFLDGVEVTDEIRTERVSRGTRIVASVAGVRSELVQRQREMANSGHVVLEGRDISTVVLPDAHWKIYLVASTNERTRRRHAQQESAGHTVDIERLRHDLVRRDEMDRSRKEGALRLAADSMVFDTTGIALDEVVETLAALIEGAPPVA